MTAPQTAWTVVAVVCARRLCGDVEQAMTAAERPSTALAGALTRTFVRQGDTSGIETGRCCRSVFSGTRASRSEAGVRSADGEARHNDGLRLSHWSPPLISNAFGRPARSVARSCPSAPVFSGQGLFNSAAVLRRHESRYRVDGAVKRITAPALKNASRRRAGEGWQRRRRPGPTRRAAVLRSARHGPGQKAGTRRGKWPRAG